MQIAEQSNCVPSAPRAERIAHLNDILRRIGRGGQIVITRGVGSLCGFEPRKLLSVLVAYDDFDALNDPHGERDFGAIDHCGAELLWKIDYCSPELQFGSDDPANPTVTHRVLTVMLAEEY